jgi:chromosome segregation ATPase
MTEHLVGDLVRNELKFVENTLRDKRAEIANINSQIGQLNGHCIDLGNEIDTHTNRVEKLNDELNSIRTRINLLADAKRDIDSQCLALEDQVNGFREYLGQK